MEKLENTLLGARRIMWDGSLSVYAESGLNENNKDMVQVLMKIREAGMEEIDPVMTLLHGIETESCLRVSLNKIKLEQLEAARAAAAAGGESESMAMYEESRSDHSTFAQDIANVADFNCFEGVFTTKLMQGVIGNALLNMNEHKKKTKEEEEEDIGILDDI
jgi:hypothetical protein